MHDPGKPNGVPPLHPRPAADFMEPSLSKPVRLCLFLSAQTSTYHGTEATVHRADKAESAQTAPFQSIACKRSLQQTPLAARGLQQGGKLR